MPSSGQQRRYHAGRDASTPARSGQAGGVFAGHEGQVLLYVGGLLYQLRLPVTLVEAAKRASKVHDIGEALLPRAILSKPGPLTSEEFAEVQRHPMLGERLLRAKRESEQVAQIVRWHHERIDGRGYPDGLRGDKIPLAARIIAVADTFEALTGPRPYRTPVSWPQAVDELERVSGSQLDPDCVRAFRTFLERLADAVSARYLGSPNETSRSRGHRSEQ